MPQHNVGLLELRVVHSQTSTDVHPLSFADAQCNLHEVWLAYLQEVVRDGGVQTHERYFADPSLATIQGSWELTARDHNDVHTGDIAIEVDPTRDLTEVAQQILGPADNGGNV